MINRKKYSGVLLLTLTLAVLSTFSVEITTPTVAKTQGVTLYGITRHDGTIYTKYTNAFKAKFPEVDNILWLERTDVSAWKSAIESGSNPVSILWGGGPSIFNTLADVGLTIPFNDTELLDYIDANISVTIAGADMISFDDSDNILWVAAALSSFGFTVNHDNLEAAGLPMPETWEDLASPVYYLGQTQHAIGMGDAPETTSNTRVYQIILQKFGWEAGWDIITRMAGNSKIFEGGSGPTRDSVITGSQAIAMTIDFYGYQAQAQNAACEYVIPKNESIVNADPIAIASSTPEMALAQKFVKFVLSAEGQALWLDNDVNRLPIVTSAFDYARDVYGNDREDLRQAYFGTIAEAGIPFNESMAGAIYDIITFYFQGALTRSSTQLYAAWDKLVKAYRDDKTISTEEYRSLSRSMSDPKISLADAYTLQDQYEANPNIRDTLVTEYGTYAKNNYNKLGNKLLNEEADSDGDGSFFDEFEVIFTNPTMDAIVDNTVDITVDVVEYGDWNFLYGVTRVEFYVDAVLIGNDTTTPYSAEWDAAASSDGPHTVKAIAYEASGRNTFNSINAYVRYLLELPPVVVTSPLDGETVNGTINIVISASETVDFPLDYVEIVITKDGNEVFSKTIDSDFSTINVPWATNVDNGDYIITITLYYTTGNSKSIEITVTVSNEAGAWKSPGFEIIPLIISLFVIVPLFSLRRKR